MNINNERNPKLSKNIDDVRREYEPISMKYRSLTRVNPLWKNKMVATAIEPIIPTINAMRNRVRLSDFEIWLLVVTVTGKCTILMYV